MTISMMNAGEKSSVETPTYIVTAASAEMSSKASSSGGIKKKHVLIVVSSVIVLGLVIAAIMIGMYMFTEANKEVVKFSLQFKASDNQNAQQDVESDPNDNVVMYHVQKPGQDVHVVNDFNKDLQVVKIETSTGTSCYISPLNRTQAMDPSRITGAASMSGSEDSNGQTFVLSSTPVSDTSFLTKKAKDMCKGVSTYWAYRSCGGQNVDGQNITRSTSTDRNKRAIYVVNKLNGMYGLGGCCKAVWACEVQIIETVVGAVHGCQFYYRTGTCCGAAIPKPFCDNVYVGGFKTPGLICP
jgi:hypothetical protein